MRLSVPTDYRLEENFRHSPHERLSWFLERHVLVVTKRLARAGCHEERSTISALHFTYHRQMGMPTESKFHAVVSVKRYFLKLTNHGIIYYFALDGFAGQGWLG